MMMLERYKITNDSLTSLTGGGQPIGASPFSFPGIVGPIIGDALTPISPLSTSSTLFYSSSQILEELRNACNCQLVAGAWKVHQGLLTVESVSGSLSFFSFVSPWLPVMATGLPLQRLRGSDSGNFWGNPSKNDPDLVGSAIQSLDARAPNWGYLA